jgi:hypothetical protein
MNRLMLRESVALHFSRTYPVRKIISIAVQDHVPTETIGGRILQLHTPQTTSESPAIPVIDVERPRFFHSHLLRFNNCLDLRLSLIR